MEYNKLKSELSYHTVSKKEIIIIYNKEADSNEHFNH